MAGDGDKGLVGVAVADSFVVMESRVVRVEDCG